MRDDVTALGVVDEKEGERDCESFKRVRERSMWKRSLGCGAVAAPTVGESSRKWVGRGTKGVRILHEEGKSVPVLLTLSVSLDVGLPFFFSVFFAREKNEKSNRFPFGTVSREDTV